MSKHLQFLKLRLLGRRGGVVLASRDGLVVVTVVLFRGGYHGEVVTLLDFLF